MLEGVLGHAGYLGEIGQRLAARFHGDLHFNHGLRERGAACLGFQAHGGKGGGKAEDLRLGQSDLRACRGHIGRHVHDGGFRRGVIVAEIDQRRAEVEKLALRHAGHIGKLRDGRGGLIRRDVGGIPQVDHRPREGFQIVVGNTQLPGVFHDSGDVRCRGRYLGTHLLDGIREVFIFCLGGIHGLPDAGKGALEIHGGLEGRGAQRQDRRGENAGHGSAGFLGGLGDGGAASTECLQGFAGLRPCGAQPGQPIRRGLNLLLGLLQGGASIVEVGIGPGNGIRVVLHGPLIRGQLAFQLFDLLGGFRVFGVERIQVFLGRDGGGIVLAKLPAEPLVLIGGGGHLVLEIGILLPGGIQGLVQPALFVIGILEFLFGGGQGLLVLLDGLLLEG